MQSNQPILIIYTGGTIGMCEHTHGLAVSNGDDFKECLNGLLKQIKQTDGALPHYHLISTDKLLDSANMTLSDWWEIAQTLVSHWHDYSGFVILHGTDTMAYTASALSFMLGEINKPVILTGAQIPLVKVGSDGLGNIVGSMQLAVVDKLHEVGIYFAGKLLRGNCTTKLKSSQLDAFHSPNLPPLAQAGVNFAWRDDLLLPYSDGPNPSMPDTHYDPYAVAMVAFYPSMPVYVLQSILDHERVKALVIRTFGMGNAPDKNKAIMHTLQQAHSRGITLVNISHCIYDGVAQDSYATGQSLQNIGIIGAGAMTLETTFAKLHFLLGQKLEPAQLQQMIVMPLAGEIAKRIK